MADPRLTDAVRLLTRNVLRQVDTIVRATWTSLPDLSDEAGELAVARVVPTVGGAQRLMASIHASYMAQVTGLGLTAPEVALLVAEADWNRSPLKQARSLMGEGLALSAALDQAARRAAQVHSGDVLRARNDATTALGDGVEAVRPVRWAKVPGPTACSWCREVSRKLYYRPDGLPVHLHDRCGLNAVTPAEAGGFTNASSVFENFRWRSRVSSAELAAVQRTVADSARALAVQANSAMFAIAA